MDKLELKYIAPYLPFNVNVKVGQISTAILTLNDTDTNHISVRQVLMNPKGWQLILRPLSDLTDEMAIKSGYKNVNALILMIISGMMPYIGMENLLSNHYDVFNLIRAGLAIDVNTINP